MSAMNVTPTAIRGAFLRFASSYPNSLPDDVSVQAKMALWAEMLEQHPWIDDRVFLRAVWWTVWHVEGFLPEPAAFLKACRDIAEELRRDEQHALPPPANPPITPQATMARYRALVSQHAERGGALRDAHHRIVRAGKQLGLPVGTDAMRDYVRERYEQAILTHTQRAKGEHGNGL